MKRLVAAFAAILIAQTGIAHAQEGENEQFFIAAERTVDVLTGQFRTVMNEEERLVLDDTIIRVDRLSNNIFKVFARYSNGRREIVISKGFLIMGDSIDWAMTYELFLGIASNNQYSSNNNNVLKYSNYIAEIIEYNTKQRSLGLPGKPWKDYIQWLGKSEEERQAIIRSLETNAQFQDLRGLVKLHAIGLVLGHEIGHQVLGHLENNETAVIVEEEEADAYAFKLQMKAGYMPITSASSFLLFSALEHGATHSDELRSHPFGVCRLYQLIKVSFEAMEEDEEFLEFIKQKGTAAQFEALKSQFDAITPQADEDCQ